MQATIQTLIQASIDTKTALLQDPKILSCIEKCVEQITLAFRRGNKVLFCGNGGSAADAQHLAAEFSGRFYIDREALPAEALHCNTSYLTAVANDYSYDEIFARLLKGIGQPGDILVGLSTSGNSKNIVRAFEVAREKNMCTIGFTGATGGALQPLSDWCINAPSTDTPRIQECHMLIGHIICQLVEAAYFQTNQSEPA